MRSKAARWKRRSGRRRRNNKKSPAIQAIPFNLRVFCSRLFGERGSCGCQEWPDILKFKDGKRYIDRLTAARADTHEDDALVVMQGSIFSIPAVAAAFEFKFIGGSMGSVVGERFVRGVEAAVEARAPFICVSASGGARMQEGLNSLMQMAKTSAALDLLTQAKLPFISILTDPTMGGVSASFAFLGDVVIAEPGALIGFAGPRVIEQTIRQKLPEGFQRAEFLLEKGFLDAVVHRKDLKAYLIRALDFLKTPTAA